MQKAAEVLGRQLLQTSACKSFSSLQAVLAAPMGVVRLMDMLGDKEALRNEALLLFMGLSRSNATIQQIAAFEGAFERLLNIIRYTVLTDDEGLVHNAHSAPATTAVSII